jgi:hypothetical protein
MSTQLKNRLKSLLWRGGMMALAAFVAFIAQNLDGLQLPVWVITILGLALGEVSKYLNTQKIDTTSPEITSESKGLSEY